ALRACEQLLLVGAMNQLTHFTANFALLAADYVWLECFKLWLMLGNIDIRNKLCRCSDATRINFQASTILKCFKALEGLEQCIAADNNTMILQHYCINTASKYVCNIVS